MNRRGETSFGNIVAVAAVVLVIGYLAVSTNVFGDLFDWFGGAIEPEPRKVPFEILLEDTNTPVSFPPDDPWACISGSDTVQVKVGNRYVSFTFVMMNGAGAFRDITTSDFWALEGEITLVEFSIAGHPAASGSFNFEPDPEATLDQVFFSGNYCP